jgi:presenilin-like A22 family membrane protease
MEKKLLFQLVALFLITQLIGLFVAYNLVLGIKSGEIAQPGIISENPNDPLNAIALIGYILIGTGVFLVSIKFMKRPFVFRILEAFIVFITSWLVFEFALGEPIGIICAALFLLARIVFSKSIWLRNASSILSAAVVGSLVGVTLGMIPVLIFVVALAAYDYIAVFKTKHMVALAKGIQGKNLAFTIAMPTKQHTFELGTGDFVVPLAFATSAMRGSFDAGIAFPNYFFIAILILIGSIFGLILTMEYLSKRIGTALPALPVQTGIMLGMFLLGKVLMF